MNVIAATRQWPGMHPRQFLASSAVLWLALYWALAPASEALVAALPVDRASHLGGAVQFFLYDTPKVLLLLTGIVFVMGMVNSAFTPERTRVSAGRSDCRVVRRYMSCRVRSPRPHLDHTRGPADPERSSPHSGSANELCDARIVISKPRW